MPSVVSAPEEADVALLGVLGDFLLGCKASGAGVGVNAGGDHHVVGGAFEVFEDFLLFEKVNRSEAKGDVVEGYRAKFGAAADWLLVYQ
jgi:hypothetical protein